MIDLKKTTFIIPIGIESEDRKINTEITISYLCKNLETNIIIYEYSKDPRVSEILSKIDVGKTNIDHIYEKATSDIFHRTKFLNFMTMKADTPVVVNYDIDILLSPNTYLKCQNKILNGQDLVYPYFWGDSQRRIFYTGRDRIKETFSLDSLIEEDYDLCRSEYGHCQFFNRDSYIKGGLENEEFISYAPEDQERGYRFKELGYNVEWSDDYVYHIEHTRGPNSSSSNPMMENNNKLFAYIKSLSKNQLVDYYKSREYLKKYSI
jgi:hypothetical protein